MAQRTRFLIFIAFISLVVLSLLFSKKEIKEIKDIPEKNDGTIRAFAVTGQVFANPDEFEYILSDVQAKDTPVLLVAGDIGNKLLDTFQSYENSYDLKLIASPGDTDIRDSAGAARFYTRIGNYRKEVIGGLNIIVLNTMLKDIADQQLTFLKTQLKELTGKPVIILLHHALWSPSLSNNWMKNIHPLLVKHGQAYVFAGDSSSTLSLIKDGVQYFTTGLRPHDQEVLTETDEQSYLYCNIEKKIDCEKVNFDNYSNKYTKKASFTAFMSTLKSLTDKQSTQISLPLNGRELDQDIPNVTYLTIERPSLACEMPAYQFSVTGKGLYKEVKWYRGLEISPAKKFFFIHRAPKKEDLIRNLSFYIPPDNKTYCENFIVNLYTEDYVDEFESLKGGLKEYSILVDDANWKKLLAGIPKTFGDRIKSDFTFPQVKAEFFFRDKKYDITLKNRGNVHLHWLYDKKSYTVTFKDYLKKNKKLLLYIPDKRAYAGEHLVNLLAKTLGLPSLESDFANVTINGNDYGVYYISEDFDKDFLAKRNMEEANIYSSDPYKAPATHERQDVPNEMIISTLKNYDGNRDRDVEYFLSVYKEDIEVLKNTWQNHFGPDDLAKMLTLFTISGSAHYDLENTFFYINPSSGRITFFPWDFMNYMNTGNLQREDLVVIPNDYLNINKLFSALLLIPEIRDMRNRTIYNNAEKLRERLVEFQEHEHAELIANFLTDPYTRLYMGEANSDSFISHVIFPDTVIKNIMYLKEKIETLRVTASRIPTNTLAILSDSFSSIQLKQITLNNFFPGDEIQIFIDEIKLNHSNYITHSANDNTFVITFKKDLFLHPTVEYEKKYAALIHVKSVQKKVRIVSRDASIGDGTIEVANTSTSKSEIIPITEGQINTNYTLLPAVSKDLGTQTFKHPLLNNIEGSAYTFKDANVVIEKDLFIPHNTTLIIKPGTKVLFAENVSLITRGKIIAKGTKDKPIVFTSLKKNKPWGVVGLLLNEASGEFSNCFFENGNDAYHKGVYFSGMLSSYYSDISIQNCTFQKANKKSGDDAVNIKNAKALIGNSIFKNNKFDGLDLDFAKNGTLVENNLFEDNGNDGADISQSKNTIIRNNRFRKSGDKGISIGEQSEILLLNNYIEKTNMGIAVKDSSIARVVNNTIVRNKVGVAGYNKKDIFGGGQILIYNSLFQNNGQDFGLEDISADDSRSGKSEFLSSIQATNSLYKQSNTKTQELIRQATEKVKSKKKLVKAILDDQLDIYSNKYAILVNSATQMEWVDERFKNKDVGFNSSYPYEN